MRFTSYFGTEKDFITAPAKLTSRQTGPQVLFSKTYEESLDTVTFDRSQINMLNIAIYLQYSITPKFDVAFNIDAVGFSFGKRQEGVLTSTLKPSSLETRQPGKPTSFNVLLVSDNDIGSLNSELVLRYRCKDNLAIKAGYCFLFAEYTTDSKLIFDNDRFRNKAGMIVLGVSYNLFNIN